jgi:hypothetical protein
MALELFTKRITAAEAPSIVPPAAPVLIAATASDLEKLEKARARKLPWHTHLSSGPRSRPEEKWYRALLDVVGDGLGKNPTTLHFELKYHAGKILEMVHSPLLGWQLVLKSSKDMDHEEYHAYVQIAVDILFTKYLPDVRRKDVLKEVYERTGLHPPD